MTGLLRNYEPRRMTGGKEYLKVKNNAMWLLEQSAYGSSK